MGGETMNPITAWERYHGEALAMSTASGFVLKIAVLSQTDKKVAGIYTKFAKSLPSHYKDPHMYFVARTFIGFVAAFEYFLQEVTTAVVTLYPLKVGGKDFKLSEVLTLSKDDLVTRAIEAHLLELMYAKPKDYVVGLAKLLSIDDKIFEEHLPVLVEAKARRDLGVHNAWICNRTYLRKLKEAGIKSKLKEGESAVPDDWKSDYISVVTESLNDLARAILGAVLNKYPTFLESKAIEKFLADTDDLEDTKPSG